MDWSLIRSAIALCLPVFPCDAEKRPLHKGGFKTASADPDQITRAFRSARAVMIGVPTGRASGMLVIDIDVRDGKRGLEWLQQHALTRTTRMHRTMSGGYHLIYRAMPECQIRNSAGKLAPGVDVRGDGGYLIHPPSPGYTVFHDAAVGPPPDWILRALAPAAPDRTFRPTAPRPPNTVDFARRALLRSVDRVARAGEGRRNDVLNAQAFHLGMYVGARLLELSEVSEELYCAARQAGLDDREIKATLHSGLNAGIARPRERDDG